MEAEAGHSGRDMTTGGGVKEGGNMAERGVVMQRRGTQPNAHSQQKRKRE